ncbi:hypothetical protein [Agromyces humi]|uniref:hypothetical protein n=1 Tax=Agromyces humi TaxID=1766800 RepID=UPI001356EE0E|nr:hypothetical protein [Agromyces humi]
MNKMFAPHRRLLTRRDGLTASIPETLVGTLVKLGVATMVGSLLVGVFTYSSTASATTTTSGLTQAAAITFADQARNADKIVGKGTGQVSFLHQTSSGECSIDTWRGVPAGSSTVDLVLGNYLIPGTDCDLLTPAQVFTAVASDTRRPVVEQVNAVQISYQNVVGRELTFPTNGIAQLAAGSQPSDVTAAEWESLEPETVKLETAAASTGVIADAKPVILTGRAPVVVDPIIAGAVVTPDTSAPVPSTIKITAVARSTTLGNLVGGVREGAKVTFTGGICANDTYFTVKFTPGSPDAATYGVVESVMTYSAKLTATTIRDLPGIPNGAGGNISVFATCDPNATEGVGAQTWFVQTLPNLNWTKATDPARPESHIITIPTGLSSASLRYMIIAGDNKPVPSWFPYDDWQTTTPGWDYFITDQTTVRLDWPDHTVYGMPINYGVRGFIPGMTYGDGTTKVTTSTLFTNIVTPAFAVPAVTAAVTWTGGAKKVAPFDGTLSWPAAVGTCPAGMTLWYHPFYYTDTTAVPDVVDRNNPLWDGGWTQSLSYPSTITGASIKVLYPYQSYLFEVETSCRSSISGKEWKQAGTPVDQKTGIPLTVASTWTGSTSWMKTESPVASQIFDICRNGGTVTCTKSAYGNSVTANWSTPNCMPGSTLSGTPSMTIVAPDGSTTTAAWGTAMGWEVGGATGKTVQFKGATWKCQLSHSSSILTSTNPTNVIQTLTILPLP